MDRADTACVTSRPWTSRLPALDNAQVTDLSDEHLAFAKATYNACWDLLDLAERTPAQDTELLATSFASRYHWYAVGSAQERVIANWMVSRAAAAVREGGLAVRFAIEADAELEASDQPAWLRASVYEGLARAYASQGNAAMRQRYLDQANAALAHESDPEDAALIAEQIATVPDA